MTTRPLMRSQLAPVAIRSVSAARGEAGIEELHRKFGLGSSMDDVRELTLPIDVHRDLIETLARLAGDPLFGVHLARLGGRDLFGVLSFSVRASPTLREALRRVASYIRLSNDTVDVHFEEGASRDGSLRLRVEGEPLCLGRHNNEFLVTLVVEEARRLTGGVSPGRVWVAHGAPDGIRLDEELGVDVVSFDAGENGLWYSARDLDRALLTADPGLLEYLDRQAETAMYELASSRGVIASAVAAVRERLEGEAPSLEIVARALGMSGRSLQRRLTSEGTSFQALLDDVRHAVARSSLAEGRLTLSEVAHRTGYTGLRPFLRAFKRWTGLTPTRYRARLAEKP